MLHSIDVIQGAAGLILTTLVLMAIFATQGIQKLDIWILIMGVAGVISLVEIIIRKAFNKQSFLYSLLLKSFRSKVSLFPQTKLQAEICSWLNTKIQNGKGILIYGKADIGKTSSIFIYLAQYTKDKDLLYKLNWVESVIYIDCKNNKSDVIKFFYNEKGYAFSNIYEKTLFIIDNLETMGRTFWENLIDIINCSTGTFILLIDADKLDKEMFSDLEIKCMRNNYTLENGAFEIYNFESIYDCLNDKEKEVILIIYYISLSMTLIPIEEIFCVLKNTFSKLYFYAIINSLLRKNLIKKFPFDHKYIILSNRIEIVKKQILFWNTHPNSNAIFKLLQNSTMFPESAWLSLVHLSYEQLLKQDPHEMEMRFSNALKCGNYITLYKALKEEIIYNPTKESIFLYELGTLCFYNSSQEEAFEKYNKLIDKATDKKVKYATMLRIIEASHGDVSFSTTKNINEYIEILKSVGGKYELYADYWELHINSERGLFSLEEYKILLHKLISLKNIESYIDIHNEIIKRCYTDIIRCSHILYCDAPNEVSSDFLNFIYSNYDKTVGDYYNDLYINANSLHYITLMDNIINGKSCFTTYNEAQIYYLKALRNGMEKQKSVSACELKCIDLKLFIPDNIIEFTDYRTKIMHFLSNAELNKVSVHVAYCKTLLAKLQIIQKLHDDNFYNSSNKKVYDSSIKSNLREAKKIFKEYKNFYGILRIEFIENIYRLSTVTNEEDAKSIIKKISDILKDHDEYRREMKVLEFLEKNWKYRMSVITIIKAYPIIMQ